MKKSFHRGSQTLGKKKNALNLKRHEIPLKTTSCHVTSLKAPGCFWLYLDSDLLEVGGEAVHVLVVGQHGVGLCLEEVDVPYAQNSQQDGRVGLQRSAAEVIVLQRREHDREGASCLFSTSQQ